MQPSSDIASSETLQGLWSHKLLEMSTELEQEGKNLEKKHAKKSLDSCFSLLCDT